MIQMRMHSQDGEPPGPHSIGDCYWDSSDGRAYIWMGEQWFLLVSNTEEFSGTYLIQEEPVRCEVRNGTTWEQCDLEADHFEWHEHAAEDGSDNVLTWPWDERPETEAEIIQLRR